MSFPVVACKTVKSKKDGSLWYAPTVELPDGDTVQLFGRTPYERGDMLETTVRKMSINGRVYLVVVPIEVK